MNFTINDYSVITRGSGEPLIFLPAGGLKGNEGLIIADYFKDTYETHMLDLPGYGDSTGFETKIRHKALADWLRNYLDLNNIQRADIAGHSLGGAVALLFAFYYPERVKTLVLLDQGFKPFPIVLLAEFGPFALAFPFLNLGVKLGGRPLLTRLLPLFSSSGERKIDEEVDEFCRKMNINVRTYVYQSFAAAAPMTVSGLNLMFSYYNINQPKLLKKVRCPVYIAYATFEAIDDNEMKRTKKYIAAMKNARPSFSYQSVKGGHYVMWQKDFPFEELEVVLETNEQKSK